MSVAVEGISRRELMAVATRNAQGMATMGYGVCRMFGDGFDLLLFSGLLGFWKCCQPLVIWPHIV